MQGNSAGSQAVVLQKIDILRYLIGYCSKTRVCVTTFGPEICQHYRYAFIQG